MPTVTLRPNADGAYSRFVLVPNAGFVWGASLEPNDFSEFTATAGAPAVVASPIHHGLYAAEFDTAANEWAYKDFAAAPTIYLFFNGRFASLPSSGNYLTFAEIYDGGNFDIILRVKNDGGTLKWCVQGAPTWTDAFLAGVDAPAIDTDFYIIFKGSLAAGTVSWEAWVNGVSGGSGNLVPVGPTNPTRIYVGGFDKAEALTNYVECIGVSTIQPPLTENRSALVNDLSDNTALQITTSTTQKETENLQDSADLGTINSVTAYARARYVIGAGDEGFKILWKLAATEVQSVEKTPAAAFGDHSDVRATDPDGNAWTWANVNALEVGAIASTLTAGDVLWFSEFYIIVDYTLFTGGGGRRPSTLLKYLLLE